MMDDAFLSAADDAASEGGDMTNAERSIRPRKIRAIEPDDGGACVRLECGHVIWFGLPAGTIRQLHAAGVMYCAGCVNAYLDSVRPAAK